MLNCVKNYNRFQGVWIVCRNCTALSNLSGERSLVSSFHPYNSSFGSLIGEREQSMSSKLNKLATLGYSVS